jgi:hypothetical protein
MPRKSWFVVILAAFTITTWSCSRGSLPSGHTGSHLPADVLFQDNFSDNASGWSQVNSDVGSVGYVDGVYRIQINLPTHEIWSNPGLDFTDTMISVEATKVDGSDDNFFGILCRFQDSDNYYFFVISSDGFYGIGRRLDGVQELIGLDSMQFSKEIKQGAVSNMLRADCVGDKLGFYVNDNLLMERSDTSFISGDVGLIVGTFEAAGTEIQFDHLTVRSPKDIISTMSHDENLP